LAIAEKHKEGIEESVKWNGLKTTRYGWVVSWSLEMGIKKLFLQNPFLIAAI
jgi:hypothetical protein